MQRLLASWRRISAFDAALCVACNRASHYRPICASFRTVSRIGDGVFWYALMAVLPVVYGAAALPVVARMLLAGVCGLSIYKWLKTIISRPRPYQTYPVVTAAAMPLDQFSFPSGHALHAVSFTSIATAQFPELGAMLVPFTVLVAASRPILGLHYPSDVLAGAVIGLLLGQAVLAL